MDYRTSLFLPYNKALTEQARELRKNPTKAENVLWQKVLRYRQLKQYKFLRQKIIDNFIVDFYCAALVLAVEADGDVHNYQQDLDEARTNRLEDFGIKVVRYRNEDILKKPDDIYQDLVKVADERRRTLP